MVIGETHALFSQRTKGWGMYFTAIGCDVTEPQIVCQYQYDIRACSLCHRTLAYTGDDQ